MMQEVEIIKVDDIVIYDNDIDLAIAKACEKLDISDLKAEGQRPWKAALQLVGKSVFPDKSILKQKNNIYINNNIPTNCNSYDYELINKLCDYYILLSNRYNKLISIIAFSYFVNISVDTIERWQHDESSSLSFLIWKKVTQNREDCLKDKGFDSSNVVGAISVGNTEFGWNMPGVSREAPNKAALPAQELPKLTASEPEKIDII